ncbi:MAG: undecaprenyl-phosphate glucose phosphotransferase [Kiloniellaceae bacterium]
MEARVARADGVSAGAGVKPLSPKVVGDLLRLLDIGLILALGLGIYYLYVHPHEPEAQGRYLVSLLSAGLLASVLFNDLGVYAGDYVFTKSLRTERMLSAWAVTFAVLLAIAFALKISDLYSRVWALGWLASSAAMLALSRAALSRWILLQGRRGRFANRTVIVGVGEQARKLAAHLAAHDAVRTRIIGFVDPDRGRPADAEVLGGIDELVRMIRSEAVDQVFVALPWNEAERLRDVVRRLAVYPVVIRLAPDLAGFDHVGKSFTQVAGLPVLHLFERPISEWAHVMKTVEDRVLAALFLVLLCPLFLVIAAAIKLDSPGPVLFKQNRYGFNNNPIKVWKFRTMYHHLRDPEARRLTTRDDARVTRVGRLLRAKSLDELPQLLNVLKGDMSLVGPRPHAVAAKAGGKLYYDVVDRYAARHRVKPGITGWAQVKGWRGETDTVDKLQKRVECDLHYIDNWSIWLDLLIIAKTVTVLFKDERAY